MRTFFSLLDLSCFHSHSVQISVNDSKNKSFEALTTLSRTSHQPLQDCKLCPASSCLALAQTTCLLTHPTPSLWVSLFLSHMQLLCSRLVSIPSIVQYIKIRCRVSFMMEGVGRVQQNRPNPVIHGSMIHLSLINQPDCGWLRVVSFSV